MRALTLTQPWCGLVAAGIKLVENRPRPMIARADFGRPFALHASREIDESVFNRIAEIAPELAQEATRAICKAQSVLLADVPWLSLAGVTSAVIGVATIDKVFDGGWNEDSIREHANELCFSSGVKLGPEQVRWFSGPIGYVLRDVRALREPVPCRGRQGFWTLPDNVAARIDRMLARLDGPPTWMVLGALVDYSPMIGAPPTVLGTRIRSEPWQLGDGQWVVKIEGRAGGVAIEALQPATPADSGAQS